MVGRVLHLVPTVQRRSGGILAEPGPRNQNRFHLRGHLNLDTPQPKIPTPRRFHALSRPVPARSEPFLEPDHRTAHLGGDRSSVEIALEHQMPIPGDR